MKGSFSYLAHFFYTHLRVMKWLKYLRTLLSLIIRGRELLTLSLSHHNCALNISLKVPSSLPRHSRGALLTYPSITLPSTPRAGAESQHRRVPREMHSGAAGNWHQECSGALLCLIRTSIQKTLSDEAFSKSSQCLVVSVPASAHC